MRNAPSRRCPKVVPQCTRIFGLSELCNTAVARGELSGSMTERKNLDRRSLTFQQAEGLVPLPSQLKVGEITKTLRARLWAAFFNLIHRHKHEYSDRIRRPLDHFVTRHLVEVRGIMADEIDYRTWAVESEFKPIFQEEGYGNLLGTVEWFLREMREPLFLREVQRALAAERAAYRVLDGHSIVPVASEEEAQAYAGAVEDLSEGNHDGARSHLVAAGSQLTKGDYAGSVRESIHAVESVARSLTGKEKFSDALRELDARNPMHGSFRSALGKLYGYASDEPGIRHPLLEEKGARVTERDALFVLAVCSAFITFVLAGYSDSLSD